MNIGAGIYGILSGDATLTAIVSTRIYPDVAPQNADNPCIVFSEQTGEFSDTHDGGSHLDTNLAQIDIYTATITDRTTLSDRVRTLLDRYSGTVNSVVIQSMQLVYSFSTVEPQFDDNAKKVYRQTMDFRVRQRV